MDDNQYKHLCARPSVMRRSEILATSRLIRPTHPALADRVAALLTSRPVPKPVGHRGGPEAGHIYLALLPEELASVTDALGELEASLDGSAASAPLLSQIGTLLGRWNRAESARAI